MLQRRWNRRYAMTVNLAPIAPWMLALLMVALPATADEAERTQSSPSFQAFAKARSRFVHSPRASVRCGPAQSFYVTSTLERGAAVEVHVETQDGWSGIRPPDGSKNWIPADSVYLQPGGKAAEIAVDRVAAWIDSQESDQNELLFQTELVKSQSVTVLGEASRKDGETNKLWFRIAPPQGEFRWVRTSQLGDDPIPMEKGNNAEGSKVQLAGFSAPAGANPNAQVPDGDEGENVVWSDESEQIARIEREIRDEQNRIASETKMPGATSGKERNPSTSAMPSAHDSDQKHWDAMRGAQNGPPKAEPMNGVLGWFGFSVVETDPNGARSSRGATPTRSGSLAQRILGESSFLESPRLASSRLDHLPRPHRRSANAAFDDAASFREHIASQYQPSAPLPPAAPMSGVWNSLVHSRGPLFGADPAETEPFPRDEDSSAASQAKQDALQVTPANYRRMDRNALQDLSLPSEASNPDRYQTPEIQDVLVQLSAMVSRPTEQWNLEPFRVSAISWIELGETPLVRGEARLLLERIEQFESLRRRSVSQGSLPASPPSPMTEAVPKRVAESGSEATGWMVSVHTSVPGQPEFALTDDSGSVIAYVRPTTGLNLRRYVQQPVTVYGMPGYLPNLAAKQIVAERVVRLR
jgi:SH3-like domain-containing protein